MIRCPHCAASFVLEFPTEDRTARTAMEIVAAEYRVPCECLVAHDRRGPVAEARQMCFWILRYHAGWSLTRIAAAFGRHHKSVALGIARIAALCATEQRVAARRRRLCVEVRRGWGNTKISHD